MLCDVCCFNELGFVFGVAEGELVFGLMSDITGEDAAILQQESLGDVVVFDLFAGVENDIEKLFTGEADADSGKVGAYGLDLIIHSVACGALVRFFVFCIKIAEQLSEILCLKTGSRLLQREDCDQEGTSGAVCHGQVMHDHQRADRFGLHCPPELSMGG